jgi:hypothetical protein
MNTEHTNPTNINTGKRSQNLHQSPFPSYPKSRDPLLPKLKEKNLPDPGLSSDQTKLRPPPFETTGNLANHHQEATNREPEEFPPFNFFAFV